MVKILAALPGLVRTAAGLAGSRREAASVAKLDQRRKFRCRLKIDVSAVAAVAAGRPAFGNVLLSTPCHDTVAAVAGRYRDLRFDR